MYVYVYTPICGKSVWKISICACLFSQWKDAWHRQTGKTGNHFEDSFLKPSSCGVFLRQGTGNLVLSTDAALMASSEVAPSGLWLFSPFGVTQGLCLQEKLQSPLTSADLKSELPVWACTGRGRKGCQQSGRVGRGKFEGVLSLQATVTC